MRARRVTRTAQSGFSLIEIVLATAVALMLLSWALWGAMQKTRERTFERAMVELRTVAAVADHYQTRVTSSAPDATTGVMTYTYAADYPNWTDASVLQSATGADMPTTSPYGTAYQFRAAGFPAAARFTVPAADAAVVPVNSQDAIAVVANGAGDTTITIMALRDPAFRRSIRLMDARRRLGEEVR